MHLLTFYCQMSDEEAGYFRIVGSPLAGPGFDAWPCYVVESDIEAAIPLHGYPGGIDEPMFAVNGDITPVESMSWSGVKNLVD